MSTRKKIALTLLIVLVLFVVGLAIVIPLLLNIDRYRPQVTAQIERETGKPVQIGHLALTILPEVTIRVDDFSLGNPAGYPTGDFVRAKKIYAVVNPFALLHHKVEITSLELDDLALEMLEDTHGKWNFENSPAKGPAPSEPPGSSSASFTLGVISKVTVERGQFTAANLLASGAPGPALMKIDGASIDLSQVDLNAFTTALLREPASPPSEFAVLTSWINSTVYAAAPQGDPAAQGTLKADALQFGALGVTKLKSKVRLYPKEVFFDDLELKCYSGSAAGNLSLNFGGQTLSYGTDARVKGINVAEFLNAFPQAKGMMTGTLEGAAKLNGTVTNSPDPLAGITGSGQASIRNGVMPSLQLGRNLRTIAKMTSLGPANGDPSSFSSIFADFRIAGGRLTSNKITVVGNGVDVDGSGSMTMAGEGTLDYQGNASLASSGSNPLTGVLAGFSGAKVENGKMTFPFTVEGTFAKPKFSLKGGARGQTGLAQQVQSAQPADVVRGIAGMFKKKKQQ
jgi:uncharacterized protein involved in outer membrane biogenesis